MKIEQIDLLRVKLPMVRSFKTGFGTIDNKQTIIIRMRTDDGFVGYGESSTLEQPVYNHETTDTAFSVLETFIAPLVVGKSFSTVEDLYSCLSVVTGNKIARTGVECAFWDILAQSKRVSLATLLGGSRQAIEVGEGIGIQDSLDETLGLAKHIVDQGYRRLKLKLAPSHSDNRSTLRAVRDAFPDIMLTIDANASFNSKNGQDISFLSSLEEFNLAMIEQPFAADDLCGHARLQSATSIPICLDESIVTAADAETALQLGSCKVINIKPGRVGGLVEASRIYDLAQSAGIGVWVGGMGETGIGRAFNIAFAAKENCIYPSDMSPYTYFYTKDIVSNSFTVNHDGTVTVTTVPGLGYAVDDEALATYMVHSATVKV